MSVRPRIVFPFLLATLAFACGGKTAGIGDGTSTESSSQVTSQSSGSGSGDSTSSATIVTTEVTVGSTCVDFELGPGDLACASDGDCTTVNTGDICSGQCECGDSPINSAGAARFASETSVLTLPACPCEAAGEPRCFSGQCIVCGFGPNQPPGCDDGGVGVVDAGADVSTSDAGECVEIDLSTFDTSCKVTSDCIDISSGDVCSNACNCGGSTINASGQARYDALINQLPPGSMDCFCPNLGTPTCVGGQCVVCGLGSTAACPDAGF